MTTTLTKENFWDEVSIKNPTAFAHFMKWLDEYKKRIEWDKLFHRKWSTKDLSRQAPKFHELPIALQMGILLEYFTEEAELTIFDRTVENTEDFASIVTLFFTANEKRITEDNVELN